MISEVALTEHQVALDRFHVVNELELVEKDFEEPLTRDSVCGVD